MVLIISESNDSITDKVIESLDSKGVRWIRINSSDYVTIRYFDNEYYIKYSQSNMEICMTAVDVLWYRRGFIRMPITGSLLATMPKTLLDCLTKDWQTFISHFYKYIENNCKKVLGSFDKEINNNKLLDLEIAKKCGLKVPHFYIINNKSDLNKIETKYITKTLNTQFNYKNEDNISCITYTQIIEKNEAFDLPDEFFPSFVQEYIHKELDLRVFFVGIQIFTVAIFSQNEKSTCVDFRNNISAKINRYVPYQLPSDIVKSLKQFIVSSNLTTGSIDMVLSEDKEYYFLEVNPSGQLEWISSLCNLQLEKYITNYLIC